MYNILLTDDEQIVIDSLTFIIQKDFPTQFQIYTAHSGSDAVQIFRSVKIDIAFVDINMPGLNGLEAIKEIKYSNPSAIIIVLSAFDRFQYAQDALNMGVYKYLTKPVNRGLISQTIRNAMSLVDSDRGKLSSDLQLKKKLTFVSPIVESDFIYSSIFSGDTTKDIVSYLDFLNISNSSFFYCCIEVPHLNEQNRYDIYMQLRETVTNATESIIGPLMMNRVIVYIPFTDKGSAELNEQAVHESASALYRVLAMRIASDIKIGVSMMEKDPSKTQSAYNEALKALEACDTCGGIVFSGALEKEKSEIDSNIVQYEQQILSRIKAGDASSLQSIAALYFPVLWKQFDNLDLIKERLFELLITARGLSPQQNISIQQNSCTFSILRDTSSRSELEQYILSQLNQYAVSVSESVSKKENPIISRAQEYIVLHLADDISLNETADFIQVNPFYLSKLFKEETGFNFIDYLTDLRLEKACELLKNPKLSIKEISHDTGYSDQNYFSKLFRRKFGITPTEFRNSVR